MKTKKEIFLDVLPRKIYKGKECIDWINSVGYNVYFVYDNIEGYLKIIKYIQNKMNPKIVIKYNDRQVEIRAVDLKKCSFGSLLKKNTSDFKIEIGTRFKDDKRDITIIDREVRNANRTDGRLEYRKWYKYKCSVCGWEEGWIDENNLNKGNGCSCCCGRTVVQGINDIPTTAPWLIPYFQGGMEEAKLYTKSSNQKINPICPDCGRVKNKPVTINTIYMNKSFGCTCKDGHSYPEKLMFNILEQFLENNFVWQYTKVISSWVNRYQYDFYFELNGEQYIIETHGLQHYEEGFERIKSNKKIKNLKEEQVNDKLKKELALKNNIKEENYIIIDCRKSELEFIKQNILNDKTLNKLFDLSKINWLKAEEFACSNLVKIACEYKKDNPNMTTTEISKLLKLDNSTISRYLKIGNNLSWCFYNVEEELEKLHSRLNKYGYSVEIFKDNISLGVFPTGAELERQSEKLFGIKLHAWNILAVCKGERGSHWGFTFKFANK